MKGSILFPSSTSSNISRAVDGRGIKYHTNKCMSGMFSTTRPIFQRGFWAQGPHSPSVARTRRTSVPSEQTKKPIRSEGVVDGFPTYETGLFWGHDTVLNPNRIAPHEISHHHISCQPIANHGNLIRSRDPRLRVLLEILHDLTATARLFRVMLEHRYTSCLFYLCGKSAREVDRGGSGRVGHD
jgi:hypothetical protein